MFTAGFPHVRPLWLVDWVKRHFGTNHLLWCVQINAGELLQLYTARSPSTKYVLGRAGRWNLACRCWFAALLPVYCHYNRFLLDQPRFSDRDHYTTTQTSAKQAPLETAGEISTCNPTMSKHWRKSYIGNIDTQCQDNRTVINNHNGTQTCSPGYYQNQTITIARNNINNNKNIISAQLIQWLVYSLSTKWILLVTSKTAQCERGFCALPAITDCITA